jgi:hypothetical protein
MKWEAAFKLVRPPDAALMSPELRVAMSAMPPAAEDVIVADGPLTATTPLDVADTTTPAVPVSVAAPPVADTVADGPVKVAVPAVAVSVASVPPMMLAAAVEEIVTAAADDTVMGPPIAVEMSTPVAPPRSVTPLLSTKAAPTDAIETMPPAVAISCVPAARLVMPTELEVKLDAAPTMLMSTPLPPTKLTEAAETPSRAFAA